MCSPHNKSFQHPLPCCAVWYGIFHAISVWNSPMEWK
jgi:hypothetical protein